MQIRFEVLNPLGTVVDLSIESHCVFATGVPLVLQESSYFSGDSRLHLFNTSREPVFVLFRSLPKDFDGNLIHGVTNVV